VQAVEAEARPRNNLNDEWPDSYEGRLNLGSGRWFCLGIVGIVCVCALFKGLAHTFPKFLG